MTPEIKYPFRLTNAFFSTVNCRRKPEMPANIETEFSIQVRVEHGDYPQKLQVNLKIESPDTSPLAVQLELISIFELVEDFPRPTANIIVHFLNEQALHMLWPYAKQMISQLTGQMGMNPINIQTPYSYNFPILALGNGMDEEE